MWLKERLLTSYVILSKLHNCSETIFICKIGIAITAYLIALFYGLNELIHVKHREQCLVRSKHKEY